MSTSVFTKAKFLAYLEKEMKDDDIILMSLDIKEITLKKRLKTKDVTFAFASDAFKDKENVGDIYYGKTPVFSICVATEEYLSPEAIRLSKQS